MSEKKLKVLMVSEASFLSSGFGTYTKEILKRLHDTGKYHIAEFACYGKVNDPKDVDIHWRYYANAVSPDDPRHSEYNKSLENQFGRWRFERVLLDFQPDVVIDIRDYWMNSYQQFSPYRPYFHWILMPTVDSAPQQEEWVDTFMQADGIFTYSDFGRDTLLEQSNNKIKYIDTTSPGVDLQTFKPIPQRNQIKEFFGLKDTFIVGSIMRNQKRKLIPELFSAFKSLVNNLREKNNPIADKIYLYTHTSYPDAGWDIPKLLKEYEIGNRVLFTYDCKSCDYYEPSLFQHPTRICKKCGGIMTMPNVGNGLSTIHLNNIINIFDIYVQYAICEGFGMPQVEAAAAGVPIASVDYSAMNDVVNKLNGYPIKINQYFKELETKAIRVYPDNDSFVENILQYISLPEILKEQKRHETRKLTEKYYDWDIISKKWQNYLDNITLVNLQGKWDKPLPPIQSTSALKDMPSGSGYDTIIGWMSENMPHHPMLSSILLLNMVKDMDYGFIINGINTQGYNLNDVKKSLENIINNHNIAMQALRNTDNLNKEDFIEYAHMKENIK